MVGDDVKSISASDTANTAFSAARPECRGFTIVPKFSRTPDEWLPAMPMARVVASADNRRRLHTPAVAPNTPQVLVM